MDLEYKYPGKTDPLSLRDFPFDLSVRPPTSPTPDDFQYQDRTDISPKRREELVYFILG